MPFPNLPFNEDVRMDIKTMERDFQMKSESFANG